MTEEKKDKKIKILCHMDSPRLATGFSRVAAGIFDNLARTGRYEIDIFGVNDLGFMDPDPKKYPYRIMPAMIPGIQGDFYGRLRFVNIVRGADRMFLQPPWDIIFTLNDPFIFEEPIMSPEIGMMDALKDLKALYRKQLSPDTWFKICCFTDNTDVLTEDGIKKITEIKIGEKLYSINPETKEVSLQEVESTQSFDFDGKLIKIRGRNLDFEVTPEHRFLLSKQKSKDKYCWITAREIIEQNFKSHRYFPPIKQKISGNKPLFFELLPYLSEDQEIWVYGDINKFRKEIGKIPNDRIIGKSSTHSCNHRVGKLEDEHWILSLKQYRNKLEKIESNFNLKLKEKRKCNGGLPLRLKMDDFINLMGWYISEGSFTGNRIDIAQSIKSKYRKEIEKLFIRLGLSFSSSTDKIRSSEAILGKILADECGKSSHTKKIPQWVFSLDSSLLEILFDSLMKGDGSQFRIYHTVSKKLAEQLIQLSLHIGFIANYYQYRNRNTYTVVVRKSQLKNSFTNKNLSLKRFKGKVYCVRVKNNHTILAGINKKFQFVGQSYWPVDSYLKDNWVEHAIGLPDVSVAYTNYGKKEIEKANNKLAKPMEFDLQTIYHGTDTEHFFPISEQEKIEFKKHFFRKAKIDAERTYIVGVVARNQMRKDLPRVMKIFKEFQKRRPESMLYIHAKENDVWGSLGEYARNFNLELGRDWIFPGNFNEAQGYPIEALNKIYNIMDIQLHATMGEGWSLALSESMATKTLNIAPNITSIPELFNTEGDNIEDLADLEKKEIRGIPVKSHSTSSEWATYGPTDYERIRPLMNVEDAVRKLIWAYDNPAKTLPIVERAYQWVQDYSWVKISQIWDNLFTKVYNDLEEERKTASDKKPDEKEEEKNEPSTQP